MKNEGEFEMKPSQQKGIGCGGYLVKVCTHEVIGDFYGIGKRVKERLEWVHLGYSETLWSNWHLSQVENALVEWAERIGRHFICVEELSATSGLIYGNYHGKYYFDVEVLFMGYDKSKVILVGASKENEIVDILSTENVAKIIRITKSKVQYHIGCK